MRSIKRIGVLTGGGDCPGLNSAIKAVVKTGYLHGIETIGIRDSWKGLIGNDSAYQTLLSADVVRDIDRQGGTILGSSRINPLADDKPQQLIKNIALLGLDGVIAIGGEDTLGVAQTLYEKHQVPVVGIPKTIDRDLSATEYTLGFESALQVITESVDRLRTTAQSHSRVFVVEVMGRNTGHLALLGGVSAGANIILIPEHPFDLNGVCDLLNERKKQGQLYGIVVVAEGAKPLAGSQVFSNESADAFGHARLGGIGEWLAQQIQAVGGLDTRSVTLSHLQRGGSPVSYDRRLGFCFGAAAVEAVLERKWGMMSALVNGQIGLVPMKDAVAKLRLVPVDTVYDTARYWAKASVLGSNCFI